MKRTHLAGTAVGLAAFAVARAAWRRSRSASLENRVAVITGGSRGLGLALARALRAEGCKVALWARDGEELDAASHALGGGDGVATAICDVGDPAQVEAAARDAAQRLGPVEILCNVAGEIDVQPMPTVSEADFRRSLDVMFWGILHATDAVLPQMRRAGWGRIVNVTSIGGKVAVPHLLPYATAKFAAVGLSEGMAPPLRRAGIRVTTVVPGLMRTGSHLRARFGGDPEREYGWFAPIATAPLLTMSAERAASEIVGAIRRGDAELVLGLPANLLMRLHGMAPGLTIDALSLMDRFMPGPGDGRRRSGEEAAGGSPEPVQRATVLGQRAAERLNQTSGS